jgi:response regulator RpfG family c-di-GMP phosphodiesterase
LRRDGYQVIEFTNPLEALVYLEEQLIHLVVSDMRMPVMDGAQFLKKVKELKPNARRILLTGFSDTEASVRAINEGGVHAYLHKPWSNDDLRQNIKDQLNEYSKSVKVKVAANRAKKFAERAEFFQKKLEESEGALSLIQSELELRVLANIFNGFLRQLSPETAKMQEKAIAIADLLCKHYRLQQMRAKLVRYACLFFPINHSAGRRGTAHDPYLLETLPLQFAGHVALERVANLLQLSLERPSREGPLGLPIEEVVIDAQIISMSIWVSKHLKEERPFETIRTYLEDEENSLFTRELIESTANLIDQIPDQKESDSEFMANLKTGQELAEDLRDGDERLLLSRGTVMTEELITVIQQYEWKYDEEPKVRVLRSKSEDI